MRNAFLLVVSVVLGSITSATAQVSVDIGLPGINIGINQPVYPDLVPVPGYPVYYAPQADSNYFFYDGMYWVYQQDNWYASSLYNGPWGLVAPEEVPLFILRVPVRYYRQPPAYFRGWVSDAPPRWGEHWGNEWEQRRNGWDHWDRSAVLAPAPLPTYQRQYSGNRYPRAEQQQSLQNQNYRYQPKDAVVQQRYQAQRAQSMPALSTQQDQRGVSRSSSVTPAAVPAQHAQPPQTSGVEAQKSAASLPQAPQPQQRVTQPQGQQPQQRAVPQTQAQQKGSEQLRPQQAHERAAQPQAQLPQKGPTPKAQPAHDGGAQPQGQQPQQQKAAPPQAQQPQKGPAPRQAQPPSGSAKPEQAPKQGQDKNEKQDGEHNK